MIFFAVTLPSVVNVNIRAGGGVRGGTCHSVSESCDRILVLVVLALRAQELFL